MATTASTEAGTAICPLCDEYEGKPSSVEAHISRLKDLQHKGEVGRGHRDEIKRRARETVKSAASDALPSIGSSDDGPESSLDEGGESGVESSEDSSLDEGGESGVDESLETTDGPVEDTGGASKAPVSAGIPNPLPVPAGYVVYGALAFFALALVVRLGSGSSSRSSSTTEQSEQEQPGVSDSEVSLIDEA